MDEEDRASLSSQKKLVIDNIYKYLEKLDGYVVVSCTFEGEPCLIVSHKQLYDHPPLGMTSRCRISVTAVEYVVHILLREVERGSMLNSPMETIQKMCSKYSAFSLMHKFCPGLDTSKYEEYEEIIRFDCKGVRMMTTPFLRIDSTSCPMWFELGKCASRLKKEAEAVTCTQCVRLKCNLDRQVKRTQDESPSKRAKRQAPSSRAYLTYMSLSSQLKRKRNAKVERDNTTQKLKRYEHTEVPLDTNQDDEMNEIVSIIENEFQDELDKLLAEGEKHGVGHKMKEIWSANKQRDSRDFRNDQIFNSELVFLIIHVSI